MPVLGPPEVKSLIEKPSTSDYFSVPDEQIKAIESVLTVTGGKVVYAADEFASLAPPLPPVSPDWSPVGKFGSCYAKTAPVTLTGVTHHPCVEHEHTGSRSGRARKWIERTSELWPLGCDCFAV
jgi:hypothetical protein